MTNFRFSLKTLLLSTLLIASVATLWWNWDPWAPDFEIRTENRYFHYGYSPHDKYIWTVEWTTNIDPSKRGIVTLYDAPTGRQLRQIRTGSGEGSVRFSPSEKYFVLNNGSGWPFYGPFISETGNLLPLPDYKMGETDLRILFSDRDNYALYSIDTEHTRHLVHLPDLKEIKALHTEIFWFYHVFSHDEKSLLVDQLRRVISIDTSTGKEVRAWDFDTDVRGFQFSPNDRVVAISVEGKGDDHADQHTCFYDRDSGLPAGRTTERLFAFSMDSRRLITYKRGPDDAKFAISNLTDPEKPILQFGNEMRQFSSYVQSKDLLYARRPTCIYDALSGKLLWQCNDEGYDSENEEFFFTHEESPLGETLAMRDIRTGDLLLNFKSFRWRRAFPKGIDSVYTASHSTDFLSLAKGVDSENYTNNNRITHWKQRRPLAWHGPLCLPEFWMSTLLAAALFWSVKRGVKKMTNHK